MSSPQPAEESDMEVEEVHASAAEPSSKASDANLSGKMMSVAEALAKCKSLVEGNKGNWSCTNVIKTGASFKLSCATCNTVFSSNNPSNFWGSHKKRCAATARGQYLEQGAPSSSQTRGHQLRVRRNSDTQGLFRDEKHTMWSRQAPRWSLDPMEER